MVTPPVMLQAAWSNVADKVGFLSGVLEVSLKVDILCLMLSWLLLELVPFSYTYIYIYDIYGIHDILALIPQQILYISGWL